MEEIFKRLIKSGSVRFISQKQSDNPRPIVIELVRLYTDDGSEWYCYATLDVETAKVFEFGVKKHLADIEGIAIALQYSQSYPSQILREEEPEDIKDVEILSRGGVSLFRPFKRECTQYGDCRDLFSLHKVIKDYVYYFNNERPSWDKGKMTPAEYEKYLETHEPIRKK